MAASTSSHRRRGGQPGNRNAVKHGFYAAKSPALPSSDGTSLSIDLHTEIALIRQSMQRVLTLGEPQTYREPVDFLRALSLASTAIARRAASAASPNLLQVEGPKKSINPLEH